MRKLFQNKANTDTTLILCGRIESAVGKIAYSTHKMLLEQKKNSCFIGLNSSLDYVPASPFDLSVNSKVFFLNKIEKYANFNSHYKSLFFKFLLFFFKKLYGGRIHGVVHNKKKLCKAIKNAFKKYNITSVIVFYRPPEILDLVYSMCKNKKLIIKPFFLDDVITDDIEKYDYYFSYSPIFLCAPWVLKDQWFSNRYTKKIRKVNLPIIEWKSEENCINTEDYLSFILFGALYTDIRNPSILFETLLKSNNNFVLKTFCSGCGDLLTHYKKAMQDKLLINDRVSTETLHREILNSDISIIIGNSKASQTPSKLFELLGSGKPILYLYQDESDNALNIIKNYPLSYVVKYDEIQKTSVAKKMFDWCHTHKKDKANYYDYIINFPEFSIGEYLRRICDE